VADPKCRSCGSSGLDHFLPFGRTPIVNNLVTTKRLAELGDEGEPTFALDVALCIRCGLPAQDVSRP